MRRRIAGREHFLSLDPVPLKAATDWLVRTQDFWCARLDELEAALRAEDAINAAKNPPAKPKPRRKP